MPHASIPFGIFISPESYLHNNMYSTSHLPSIYRNTDDASSRLYERPHTHTIACITQKWHTCGNTSIKLYAQRAKMRNPNLFSSVNLLLLGHYV